MSVKSALARLLGVKPEVVRIEVPSPIDVRIVYRSSIPGGKFYATPEECFAKTLSAEIRKYTAFRAGGKWYGFRGHFERIDVVEGAQE